MHACVCVRGGGWGRVLGESFTPNFILPAVHVQGKIQGERDSKMEG